MRMPSPVKVRGWVSGTPLAFPSPRMITRSRLPRRCSYVVTLDTAADQNEVVKLAAHLSTMGSAGCEVIVLDSGSEEGLEERKRILRWVGRHVSVEARHRLDDGAIDLLPVAVELAAGEKIIIAASDSRYTAVELGRICDLLDKFEAVEPEEFVQPLPWWGGIDAGRILLHRGVDQKPAHSTFAFRKSAWRPFVNFEEPRYDTQLGRLEAHGTDIHSAREVFVRCEPPAFKSWLRLRSRDVSEEYRVPIRSGLFLALFPLLLTMTLIGGIEVAGGYAGVIAFGSMALAVRGRAGAAKFFPLRACLYAPLWIAERSVSAYWALFSRLRGRRAGGSRGVRSSTPFSTACGGEGAEGR